MNNSMSWYHTEHAKTVNKQEIDKWADPILSARKSQLQMENSQVKAEFETQ